jgi:hypothetical protein
MKFPNKFNVIRTDEEHFNYDIAEKLNTLSIKFWSERRPC